MTLSNSVLRRYTPPTCSLQIVALNSPVSRRTGHQLRFELRFDDPQLPEHQKVNIQGNSDQLEALHEAVTTYVQNLLNSSPDRFNAVFSAQAPLSSDPVVSSSPQALNLSNSQDSSSDQLLDSSSAPKEQTTARSGKIFLQPGRGIFHNLFLGPLATKESGSVVQLSMLQLFDLATALDAYAADRVVVPALNRRSTAGPSAWASIAAVLLLGVGLTTAVLTLNRSDTQQQTVNKATGSSSKEQPIALQPSPLPTLGASTPPLSSPESLPSVPPLGSIVPSPSPSTPTIAPQTPIALPSAPPAITPQTPLVISGTPPAIAPNTTPVIPVPRITPGSPILINPVPRQNSSVSIPGEATTATTNGVQSPMPVAPPAITIPSPSLQLTPPNSKLEAALSEANRGSVPALEASGKPTAQQSLNSAQTQSPSTPTTNESTTAFNNIPPQVAEARDYFNQRWEPPASLQQTLQYSLVLDVDGTIQRIEPLGQAARNYVDRTGMPLIGERFVSGNKNGQTPRIRVVLAPDGKVQTFLEEYAQAEQPRRPNEVRKSQPRVLTTPAP